MDKKIAAAMLAAFLISATANAADMKNRLGLWGGYGSVGMKEMNEALGGLSQVILGAEVKKISAIAGIGAEFGMGVSESVLLCARAGFMKTQVTSAELSVPLLGSAKFEAWGTAMPVMAGFRYMIPIDDNLWAGFGAFGGVAKVTANARATTELLGVEDTVSMDYEGTPLALEGLLCFDYRVSEGMSIGGDLGYTSIKAETMKVARDIDYDGDGVVDVEKGDKIVDGNGEDIAMDLSGVAFALSLNFMF